MKILLLEDNSLASEVNALLIKALYPHAQITSVDCYTKLLAYKCEHFDGLLSDLCLPAITPLELVGKLEKHFPELPVLFMSSLSPDEIDYQIIRRRGYPIISKCLPLKNIQAHLRQHFDHAKLDSNLVS